MAINYDYGRGEPAIREYIDKAIPAAIESSLCEALDMMEERFREMEKRPTAGPQDVRMACVAMCMEHASKFVDAGDALTMIDTFAQYVLTGKKPGAEG